MTNIVKKFFLKIVMEYKKANEVWLCWREQFGELYWQPFKQAIRSGPFWYIQLLNYFTLFRIYTIGTLGALSAQYVFIEIKQTLASSYSAEVSEQLFKMVLNTFSAFFQIWLLWLVMHSVFRFIVQRTKFTRAFSRSARVFLNYTLMYYYQVFSFSSYEYRTADIQTLVYPLINLFLFSLNIWLIHKRISNKICPTKLFNFIMVELDTFNSLIAVEDRWQSFIQLCSFGETNTKDREVGLFDQSGHSISKEYQAVVKLRYSPIRMDIQWAIPTRIHYIGKKWKKGRTVNEDSENN